MLRPQQEIEDIASYIERTYNLTECEKLSLAYELIDNPEIKRLLMGEIGRCFMDVLPEIKRRTK